MWPIDEDSDYIQWGIEELENYAGLDPNVRAAHDYIAAMDQEARRRMCLRPGSPILPLRPLPPESSPDRYSAYSQLAEPPPPEPAPPTTPDPEAWRSYQAWHRYVALQKYYESASVPYWIDYAYATAAARCAVATARQWGLRVPGGSRPGVPNSTNLERWAAKDPSRFFNALLAISDSSAQRADAQERVSGRMVQALTDPAFREHGPLQAEARGAIYSARRANEHATQMAGHVIEVAQLYGMDVPPRVIVRVEYSREGA